MFEILRQDHQRVGESCTSGLYWRSYLSAKCRNLKS